MVAFAPYVERKGKNMNTNNYNKKIQERWNRKKHLYHSCLGISRMMHKPLLNLLFLPIILLTVFVWSRMDLAFTFFNVPKVIMPIYSFVVKTIGVLIPIILVWTIIYCIGSLTARKDEILIRMAYMDKELRNGSPILVFKHKDKQTGVTIREWYSPLPMKLWVERQNEISDALNINIIELKYAGNKRDKIYLKSKKGKFNNQKILDNELEQDMDRAYD